MRQFNLSLRRWIAVGIAVAVVAPCATALGAGAATRPSRKPLPPGVEVVRDLKYGEAPGVSNLLDIYFPDKAPSALPLIVYIHGGGWSMGDKQDGAPLSLVSRGYILASINYRFSRQGRFPAQIFDCKGAIRWLRANSGKYFIDPHRIGVWGASAGGHLAALLGTSGDVTQLEGRVGGNLDQTSRVEAAVDWYGPTDMLQFFQEAGPDTMFKSHPIDSPVDQLFGGDVGDHRDLVELANPIAFATPDDPPFLIMHGDHDQVVPVQQSRLLASALRAAGVDCDLRIVQGAWHGKGFGTREVSQVTDFFDKHFLTHTQATTRPSDRDLN